MSEKLSRNSNAAQPSVHSHVMLSMSSTVHRILTLQSQQSNHEVPLPPTATEAPSRASVQQEGRHGASEQLSGDGILEDELFLVITKFGLRFRKDTVETDYRYYNFGSNPKVSSILLRISGLMAFYTIFTFPSDSGERIVAVVICAVCAIASVVSVVWLEPPAVTDLTSSSSWSVDASPEQTSSGLVASTPQAVKQRQAFLHEFFCILFGLSCTALCLLWMPSVHYCVLERRADVSKTRLDGLSFVSPCFGMPAVAFAAPICFTLMSNCRTAVSFPLLATFPVATFLPVLYFGAALQSTFSRRGLLLVAIPCALFILFCARAQHILEKSRRLSFVSAVKRSVLARQAFHVQCELDLAIEPLLPRTVWQRVIDDTSGSPSMNANCRDDSVEAAVVIVFEIEDFARWSQNVLPIVVVEALAFVFSHFELAEKLSRVDKAKITGDRYIATCGLVNHSELSLVAYAWLQSKRDRAQGELSERECGMVRRLSSFLAAVHAVQFAAKVEDTVFQLNDKLHAHGAAMDYRLVLHAGSVQGRISTRTHSVSYDVSGVAVQEVLRELLYRTQRNTVCISLALKEVLLDVKDIVETLGGAPGLRPNQRLRDENAHPCMSAAITWASTFSFCPVGGASDERTLALAEFQSSDAANNHSGVLALNLFIVSSQMYPPEGLEDFSVPQGPPPKSGDQPAVVVVADAVERYWMHRAAQRRNDDLRLPFLRSDVSGYDATHHSTAATRDVVGMGDVDLRNEGAQGATGARALIVRRIFRNEIERSLPPPALEEAMRDLTAAATMIQTARNDRGSGEEGSFAKHRQEIFERFADAIVSLAVEEARKTTQGASTVVQLYGRDSFRCFVTRMRRKPKTKNAIVQKVLEWSNFWTGISFDSPFADGVMEQYFQQYLNAAYVEWRIAVQVFLAMYSAVLLMFSYISIVSFTHWGRPEGRTVVFFTSTGFYLCLAGIVLLIAKMVLGRMFVPDFVRALLEASVELIRQQQHNYSQVGLFLSPSQRFLVRRIAEIDLFVIVVCLWLTLFGLALLPMNFINVNPNYFFQVEFLATFMISLNSRMSGVLLLFHLGSVLLANAMTNGPNLVLSIAEVPNLFFAFSAMSVATKSRSIFERDRFAAMCFDRALQRASEEELRVLDALHRMLIPSHLTLEAKRIALEMIATASQQPSPQERHAMLGTRVNTVRPFVEFYHDVCVMEIVVGDANDVEILLSMLECLLCQVKATAESGKCDCDLSDVLDTYEVLQKVSCSSDSVVFAGPFPKHRQGGGIAPPDGSSVKDLRREETARCWTMIGMMTLLRACCDSAPNPVMPMGTMPRETQEAFNHGNQSTSGRLSGKPKAVACCGSAFGALFIGGSSLFFHLVGDAVKQSHVLQTAAPDGFLGATETFVRGYTELRCEEASAALDFAALAALNSAFQCQPQGAFGHKAPWRVRGAGLLQVFSLS